MRAAILPRGELMIRASVVAVLAAMLLASASAQPAGWPAGTHPGPSKNVICPAQVMVKFVPNNPVALSVTGWQANEGPFPVQLDPANLPRISGGNMVCYYKLLNQPGAFNILQPVGNMKCSPMSNGTGFVCTL